MMFIIVNFFKRLFSLHSERASIKLFSLEILPVILVPSFMFVASLGFYSSVVVFIVLPFFILHVYIVLTTGAQLLTHKKFFFIWNIASLFYIFVCLEFIIVPLMVISPWENFIFYVLLVIILIKTRQIKRKGILSVINERKENYTSLINERYCSTCCKKVSDKSVHCSICRICVLGRKHHNVWFDSCISYSNYADFLILLTFLLIWMIYTAYLILTTVCIPVLKLNTVLIPQDCSHVYSDFKSSITFVGAVYCCEIAAFIFILLLYECMYPCMGI